MLVYDKPNAPIESLDISGNPIGSFGVTAMVKAIIEGIGLTEI